MVEDATLNEFQSVENGPPTDDATEPDVSPATITYAYSPDGAQCDACGAVVQRRWILEESLVCPSCMEW